MADKTIGGCVRTSFAGTIEPEIYLGWKRASTWQLRGSSGRKASTVVVAIVMLIWLDVKTKTNWMDRRRKCVMRWEMVDWVFWDLGFGFGPKLTPSSMRNWEWRLHHLSLSLVCFSHFHLCYRLYKKKGSWCLEAKDQSIWKNLISTSLFQYGKEFKTQLNRKIFCLIYKFFVLFP